mmetsp:Transcript_56200/g.100059  ORF Transcript_56200/g.100059 Transcript_56200/m.100059 type:complete len:293 (-) Transcript_56200:86-964(-)
MPRLTDNPSMPFITIRWPRTAPPAASIRACSTGSLGLCGTQISWKESWLTTMIRESPALAQYSVFPATKPTTAVVPLRSPHLVLCSMNWASVVLNAFFNASQYLLSAKSGVLTTLASMCSAQKMAAPAPRWPSKTPHKWWFWSTTFCAYWSSMVVRRPMCWLTAARQLGACFLWGDRPLACPVRTIGLSFLGVRTVRAPWGAVRPGGPRGRRPRSTHFGVGTSNSSMDCAWCRRKSGRKRGAGHLPSPADGNLAFLTAPGLAAAFTTGIGVCTQPAAYGWLAVENSWALVNA